MEVDPPQVKEEKMDVDEDVENKEKENMKPQIVISAVDDAQQRHELITIIKRLEGVLIENPHECTHIIMPKLRRTDNLLLSLPTVKHILATKWIIDSGEAGRWINEEGYLLEDPEAEQKYNFSLAKTLSRSNRDKLFMGKIFYLTPSVKPTMQTLTNIITYSGGR